MARDTTSGSAGGPIERLKSEARSLAGALGDRAMASVRDRVQEATGRLSDYAEGGGGPGIMAAVTGAKDTAEGKSPARSMLGAGAAAAKEKIASAFGKGGKGGGQGKNLKVTNIIESVDVGVPVKLAYNQWTQFADFPSFMKKVESVEQPEDHKLNWKAQVFWSHRTWESTIVHQVPDDKIVWRSKGEKGHVDGAVTFHELAPNLTRVLVVLEYHPQGLFEHTGNLWRAQGRRARLELKHFRRHVMTQALLSPDEIEGWRGTIEDGEVVESHEDAIAREEEDSAQDGEQAQAPSRSRGEAGETAGDQDEEAGAAGSGDRETGGRAGDGERPGRGRRRGREPAARARPSAGRGGRTERRQPAGAGARRGEDR